MSVTQSCISLKLLPDFEMMFFFLLANYQTNIFTKKNQFNNISFKNKILILYTLPSNNITSAPLPLSHSFKLW